MTRYKSELLSAMGSGFEILKAITDAVIERGGTDDDVRRILRDKRVRNAVVEMLLADQKVFSFSVNFDDPKWKERLFSGNYKHSMHPNLHIDHFPVRHKGIATVTVELVQYENGVTFSEHLSTCKEQRLPEIDRPISEMFHMLYPIERKKGWIVSVCSDQFVHNSMQSIACVEAGVNGVGLGLYKVDRWLDENLRFLVLREVKTLAP